MTGLLPGSLSNVRLLKGSHIMASKKNEVTATASSRMAKQVKAGSKKSNARANATSVSWENDKTRAARIQKDAVTVSILHVVENGPDVWYGSVRKAFTAYRLPDAKHREFRA